MSPPRKPAERGADSLLPRADLLGPSGHSTDLKLNPVFPAFGTEDCSEISMIRLIALVEADRSIVEEDATARREGLPLFEIEKHWRVGRRCSLHSLERGRKTARGTEKFWMIEQCAKRGHSGMTRSSDPTSRRRVQHSEVTRKYGGDCNRINRIGLSCHSFDFRHDHLRQHTFFVQFSDRLLGLQSRGQHHQNGKFPDWSPAVSPRQEHRNLFSSNCDCFSGFQHRPSVPFPNAFSNP